MILLAGASLTPIAPTFVLTPGSAELPAARGQREWLDALFQDSRMSEDEGFDAPFAGEAHRQPA